MGLALSQVKDTTADAQPLVIVSGDDGKDAIVKVSDALSLAVAQRNGGPLTLARVTTRKVEGKDTRKVTGTGRLVDIAAALNAGLITT